MGSLIGYNKTRVVIMESNTGENDYELEVECSKCRIKENLILHVTGGRLNWFIENKHKYVCKTCI